MNWLHYLLEANLYLTVAYSCYWLLFRKQTFYTANRIYLLASTVLCFVIPLVQVGAKEPVQPAMQKVRTSAAIVYPTQTVTPKVLHEPFLTPNRAPQAIYWLVTASMCVWLITKLYSLLKLICSNEREAQQKVTLVYVNDEHTPFSFFGYLFVDRSGQLSDVLLRHEMVHIGQKHSWDIIFVEVIKIINWFNPVVYLLQNSLKALHEFEADRLATSEHQAPDSYVDFLIAQAYHSNGLPFAHQFSNKQLLKSRIMKLYQKRSGKLARLNYLLALPLCAGLLCASSLAFSKNYGWIKVEINDRENSDFNRDSSLEEKTNKWAFSVLYKGKMTSHFQFGIKEPNGNITYYKPGTFTDTDKRHLSANYGMEVTIINQINNIGLIDGDTTTVDLPMYGTIDTPKTIKSLLTNDGKLPPPKVFSVSKLQSPAKQDPLKILSPQMIPVTQPINNKPVGKGAKIPPLPPSAVRFALPKKAIKPAKAEPIMFPPPKVYDELSRELKPINNNQSVTSSIIKPSEAASVPANIPNFQKYQGFTDYIQKTFNYPYKAIAGQTAGYTMVAFRVNGNHMLNNAHITESLSPETDAAILQCFNSYKAPINAKPGDYTMGFVLAIEGANEKDSLGNVNFVHGFNLGKKIRTGKDRNPSTLTMMLIGKKLQPRTSKIKKPATLKPEFNAAKKSFIKLETARFRSIASFTKVTSTGC